MKNNNSLIKIIIIVLSLLILFFSLSFINKKNNDNEKNKKQTIIKKYDLEYIEDLNFNFRNINANFYSTNKDKLVIKQIGKSSKLLVDVSTNDEKLVFKEKPQNIFSKVKYKIYIPDGYSNNINIINAFGILKIDTLYVPTSINNNTGNISISSIDTLDITNASGNISIKNITSSIDLTSSTGDVSINKLTGRCNMETITGDISINKFNILENSNIESTAGDISIKVQKTSSCNLILDIKDKDIKEPKDICNNGQNNLLIKNITGTVNIK